MSKPKISNIDETNGILKFTLSDINVSYANGIRRTILGSIPCYVFRSEPYEKNEINIIKNKTRLNNELIKQRISCIPIHIDDLNDFPFQDYIVELNMKNTTNNIMYVTTEHFTIKNIKTNNLISVAETHKIFPPNGITGDYIDILRLRPKLGEGLNEEEIQLEASINIGTAEENGMFNVVSTCSYGNTKDGIMIKEKWQEVEKELKDKKVNKQEIEKIKKDWMILDSKRYYIEDSFDFIIETIGVYTNFKILDLACSILIKNIYKALDVLKNDVDNIEEVSDTMNNTYNIILDKEDYTVGKILEYNMYKKYFEKDKVLNYVGFLKKHPHHEYSLIKISAKNILSKDEIIVMLNECVNDSIILLNEVKKYFEEK